MCRGAHLQSELAPPIRKPHAGQGNGSGMPCALRGNRRVGHDEVATNQPDRERRQSMFKKIALATVTVAALIAPSSLVHAGIAMNGHNLNGIAVNGIAVNGLTLNGIAVNGLTLNGIAVNGLTLNGIAVNGLTLNGIAVNGIAVNGI